MALAACVVAGGAFGQTAEQLRQWQKLSPEQRSQLLKAFNETKGTQPEAARPLEQPEVMEPRSEATEPEPPSALEQRYAGRTGAAHLRQSRVEKSVDQQLEQFGYDLFQGTPTTFAPATDIPVPADYVIGPGDTIEVQLFGKENEQHTLVVTRDGRIHFPEIGAISVAGLKFSDLREDLERRVAEQMIGNKASVTMGALRSIRIFILGDVTRPGSYTVSALSSMTNALFVGGGVRRIGSLRNIQLKRNGRLVTRLDLYDLLLRGDTSDDMRLQPGDVIFVPPIGQTAGVAGEVRRPAIYELRGENSVGQLIEMAGGLLPTAAPKVSQLERIDEKGNFTLLDVDLDVGPDEPGAAQPALQDGDMLRVYPSLDRMEGVVLLAGHVQRPGGTAWRERMRITDLLPTPDHLMPQADLDYVVIRREERPLAKVKVFSTRLSAAWSDPQSDANVLLEPRDQVLVFALQTIDAKRAGGEPSDVGPAGAAGLAAVTTATPRAVAAPGAISASRGGKTRRAAATRHGEAGAAGSDAAAAGVAPQDAEMAEAGEAPTTRQELLQPILGDLIAQARSGEPTRIVAVGGLIREPGDYPLEPGMRVADLIRAGGGLAEAAYALGAEVTRYDVASGEKREISHVAVDLSRVLHGDASADVALQPYDRLMIKRLPEWAEHLVVQVRGEVRFPGSYPIRRGERLSDVLARVGGLTEQAFAEGSVFTREELRVKEQERLDTLARQLESDITAASLERVQEDAKQAEALAAARGLLPQLKQARATGRLVIDLPRLMEEGASSTYDVVLKGGDQLIVPPRTQEVTVIGEVQHPTSHLIEAGLDFADYVDRSGGYTYKADDDRGYVVRANGQVETAYSGWWIFRSQADVKPGDTIVIPLDVERMRPLTLWTSVTQIIYQLAFSVAALNTIGAF